MSIASTEPVYRYTYSDYMQWTGDERWELIDGVPYDMTPAANRRHQMILGALHLQIGAHFEDAYPVQVFLSAFDVRLPDADESDENIRTIVQPDLCVVCDPAKLDKQGCRGTPDWIIEILSPSTAAKDRTTKRDLYERHGVREYWIIDWDALAVTIYDLQPNGKFAAARALPIAGSHVVTIFPELVIDWDRVVRHVR